MRLFVYLLEGREWAVKDSYMKLKVGRSKSKTRVLMDTKDPVWNEEFVFRVHDSEDELVLSVYQYHEDTGIGFFNVSRDLVGRVKIPLWSIAAEENQNLPPTWFSIKKHRGFKAIQRDCGKILLSLSLHGKGQSLPADNLSHVHPSIRTDDRNEWDDKHDFYPEIFSSIATSKKMLEGKQLVKAIAGRLERLFNKSEESSTNEDSSEISTTFSDNEDAMEDHRSSSTFEELIEMMLEIKGEREMPENLQGGILLDQMYAIPPKDLCMLLFAPNSQLLRDLAELQGTTNVEEGPWKWKPEEKSCLTRVVTYTKAATKLVKAVKATEEQTFIQANGREFVVFVEVSTPEVPYGNTFKVDLLYKITPGQEKSEEESAHLVVSWEINFHQQTMMRGIIEGGARQGLKESFDQFSNLLAQNLKAISTANVLDKDHMLATLKAEHQSDWQLAREYFWNLTVFSSICMALYAIFHILCCGERKYQGLEFHGIDLPDSIGEIITGGFLVIQLERVYNMVTHFVQARFQRGSDHGIKAQGDGWVLTIALVEGMNIASLDSKLIPDPYVVFTCNGKTRTSSVKLQTLDPLWNEILEFDASAEPPSVLDAEIFDFDGPFDQASSLGHAEINFLKHTSTELADMWVPLEGKLAQSSQSKLHLRIFLDNENGVETIRDYLRKMEKEVGKKLNLRSPKRNSTFQKIFGLPPEEFLISDFSCSMKRKMPLQGRLFLSARIVGFYANLFGHKTKFFFLWEDIEDIHVLPPSLGSVGSPSLVIILHKGRGIDAKHGAKSQDEEGRLYFYFHSFVSFNVASRTVTALWRTRTLTPDQRAQIADEQQDNDEKRALLEDSGSYLIAEDVEVSKVLSVDLPIGSLIQMFDGEDLEHKVMRQSGCLNYTTTAWEPVTADVFERHISYKFNRCISVFGGEVTCTQQKVPISTGDGWIVNEIMTLHDVPFSDYFCVQLKYEVQNPSHSHGACNCCVYVGVKWLKSTKFEKRVTRNIVGMFTHWSKEILQMVEREALLASG